MEKEIQKRQTAHHCEIKEITSGTFLKEEGFEPSYIITQTGRRISRVNILGVIVAKNNTEFYESILLDDGTDRISVRSFEKKGMFDSISLGTLLLLIGRVREYQQERYLAAEVVRKMEDARWVELRRIEVQILKRTQGEQQPLPKQKLDQQEKKQENMLEEKRSIEDSPEDKGPVQKMYELIKELDKGQGADYDLVLKHANVEQGETVIQTLIKNGDVFEIKPGKLKVLS